LLHDQTEFQSRVAAAMQSELKNRGVDVRTRPVSLNQEDVPLPAGWQPDLVYVIFSNEAKALQLVARIAKSTADIPLLFGRSLLRESFLSALGDGPGEFWFVDMFHRNGGQTPAECEFFEVMAANGVRVPTANHAFGWDGMAHCAAALQAGAGDPSRALDYLESGVVLAGASGVSRFSADNHNGRFDPGPHTITRWLGHRLENLS
jgi:ABC-type branched-subunit amino acid transport system substrate-binding protein